MANLTLTLTLTLNSNPDPDPDPDPEPPRRPRRVKPGQKLGRAGLASTETVGFGNVQRYHQGLVETVSIDALVGVCARISNVEKCVVGCVLFCDIRRHQDKDNICLLITCYFYLLTTPYAYCLVYCYLISLRKLLYI